MQVKVEKQPKSTLKLEITIPVTRVKETYGEVLNEVAKNTTIQGFRKGQAPINLVKEKTQTSELYGEVVNKLLETYYPQALKENKISPVSNPKVEIKEFDLEKDFEFVATIALKPEVKIKPEYKSELKKTWVKIQKDHTGHDHEVQLSAGDVIKTLIENSELEVADLLIEEEVNRMFSRLIQQTQAVGISMEDFLKSQNKTAEDLRKDYQKTSEESIKAEFILSQLTDEEKIEVTEKEIDAMVAAVGDKDAAEKMNSPMQRWYIKSVLAKNKLVEKLIEEVTKEVKK